MEQPYWVGIHDSLADGIQFVKNHVRLTKSIEGSPQRPVKKKARFSCVLDTQIQIHIPQPHPPIPPPPPGHRSFSPPPVVGSTLVFDSPSQSHPPLSRSIPLPARSPPLPSPPCHCTPTAPGSPLPPPQTVPPIQIILIIST